MEISRPVRNLFRFFGLMNFFLGLLQILLQILILAVLFGVVQDLSLVFHILPGTEKIGIVDLFEKSEIPPSTFILLSIPLALIFIILPLILLVLSLLLFFQGFLLFRIAKVTRMEISPEGVSLVSPGMSLQSGWKNIQGVVHKSYWYGLRQYDVLGLIEPARQSYARWIPFWSRYPTREIPLFMFADWRGRELGQAAKQYAPWILGDDKG